MIEAVQVGTAPYNLQWIGQARVNGALYRTIYKYDTSKSAKKAAKKMRDFVLSFDEFGLSELSRAEALRDYGYEKV
jgi:hypothetical protein